MEVPVLHANFVHFERGYIKRVATLYALIHLLKSSENIEKNEGGLVCRVSNNKFSSVP